MPTDFSWIKLKQLNTIQVLLAFLLPSGIAFTGFRFILPWMVDYGFPKVLMWGVIASVMLLFFAIVGFYLIQKEANENDTSPGKRLLLKKIGANQWQIYLGIVTAGLYSKQPAGSRMADTVKFIRCLSIRITNRCSRNTSGGTGTSGMHPTIRVRSFNGIKASTIR